MDFLLILPASTWIFRSLPETAPNKPHSRPTAHKASYTPPAVTSERAKCKNQCVWNIKHNCIPTHLCLILCASEMKSSILWGETLSIFPSCMCCEHVLCVLLSVLSQPAGWGGFAEPSVSQLQPVPAPPKQSATLRTSVPLQVRQGTTSNIICYYYNKTSAVMAWFQSFVETGESFLRTTEGGCVFRLQSPVAFRDQPQPLEGPKVTLGRQPLQVSAAALWRCKVQRVLLLTPITTRLLWPSFSCSYALNAIYYPCCTRCALHQRTFLLPLTSVFDQQRAALRFQDVQDKVDEQVSQL